MPDQLISTTQFCLHVLRSTVERLSLNATLESLSMISKESRLSSIVFPYLGKLVMSGYIQGVVGGMPRSTLDKLGETIHSLIKVKTVEQKVVFEWIRLALEERENIISEKDREKFLKAVVAYAC
jgi:hypothetical protein